MTTDDQLRRRLQAAAFGFGNDSPLDLVNRLVNSARGPAPRLLNDVRDCTRMLTRPPIADALAELAQEDIDPRGVVYRMPSDRASAGDRIHASGRIQARDRARLARRNTCG